MRVKVAPLVAAPWDKAAVVTVAARTAGTAATECAASASPSSCGVDVTPCR
ncbi:MAG TPA: hypothetical protein VL527_15460 [Dongiaceae bacterium]|nr:hypothetical protein [Dongiaceae bacterium]